MLNKNGIHKIGDEFIKNSETEIDYKIEDKEIIIEVNNQMLKYNYDIHTNVTRSILSIILSKVYEKKTIIVSDYINPVISDELKKNDINFIDAAGNCFIKSKSVYIFVKGKKHKILQNNLFLKNYNITDIKLIFAVLTNNELINTSQRNISKFSRIPLGSVGNVLKKLESQKFLIKFSSGKRIINKKELFEKWCIAYSDKFKPKIFLGKFKGDISLTEDINGKWGGEPAAYLLKKVMKPEIFIIYVNKNKFNEFLFKHRLVTDDQDGYIEIYDNSWFSNEINENYKSTVHPFIVYADLLSGNNQRNTEVAKIIYRDYIEDKLG
jgi:hypothetical protein